MKVRRDHLDPETHAFVDRMGAFFEQLGLTMLSGRILGYLLMCDPATQSAKQLAYTLAVSSGGVSTQVRGLIQIGLVERVHEPGDRQHYYRLRDNAFENAAAAELERVTAGRILAEDGLNALAQAPAARKRRLHEMLSVYSFLEQEWPKVLAHYAEARSGVDADSAAASITATTTPTTTGGTHG